MIADIHFCFPICGLITTHWFWHSPIFDHFYYLSVTSYRGKSYFFPQIPISVEDPVGVKKTGGELAATLGVGA